MSASLASTQASFAGARVATRPAAKAASVQARAPVAVRAEAGKGPVDAVKKALFSAAAAATLATGAVTAPPPAEAALTAGNPITNARALLRYGLPISNKPIREVQNALEEISQQLRIPGSKSLGPVGRNVNKAASTLKSQEGKIKASFAASKVEKGNKAIVDLTDGLVRFQAIIKANDKQAVPIIQQECLGYVGIIEEAMLDGLPFEIPAEYASLPTLTGYATITMDVKISESQLDLPLEGTMVIVADGYNAPLSAGDFVDLVQRGFYDGMEVQRSDDFVVQTGDPEGRAEGFVGSDGNIRRVPLEIRAIKDKEPTYDYTFEDLGRANDQPALPFNAYGTMAMARAEFENNSASSQVFWLKRESEITPSSANLLDGRYSVFGYVVEGADYLNDMKVGDLIKKVTVVEGIENLKNGGK